MRSSNARTGMLGSRRTLRVIALAIVGAACAKSSGAGGTSQPAPVPSERASTVGSAEISRQPNESVDKYLNGRFPGVTVSPSQDGGVSIRIRGASSVHGNNEPLYILDGIVLQPSASGSLAVNPYDIASIKVLKDATDITMYGVRGANGVIVIKTKRAQ
ncbi:MAG: TonB-dependent receptor plug domain-containing protein [Gemmatimonadaceae bacterium]